MHTFKYIQNVREYMVEKRRYHFNWKEVKTSSIEFILENDGPVGEPTIRKHLQNQYNSIDQATVNKHLHGLQDLGCIESVSPLKKSRYNYWDIKSKHFKNINNKFPAIQLNTYRKSLLIIFLEFGQDMNTYDGFQFYISLMLSKSLFNACTEIGVEGLINNAYKIYRADKDQSQLMANKDILGSVLDLLLEHFIKHDVMLGITNPEDAPEELEFAKKFNPDPSELANFDNPLAEMETQKRLHYLSLASNIMVKYKQPISGIIYNNYNDAYRRLKEIYIPWLEITY